MASLPQVLSELAVAADLPLTLLLPSGSEPDPLQDLYATWVAVPGAITHAQDGGGAYPSDYQIDFYARGQDPLAESYGAAERFVETLAKPTYLVLTPPRPFGGVDEQGYARTQVVLRRYHSL